VARLGYLALTELRHDGTVYQPGDDISHFALLMPNLRASVSVGSVQLEDSEGLRTRPRFEVRTSPYWWGLMSLDIAEAQVQGTVDALAEAPLLPAPEPDADDEEDDFFDPAEYTIPQVMEWAEANPDEVQDLIAAEAQGKARTTLLARLDALAAE